MKTPLEAARLRFAQVREEFEQAMAALNLDLPDTAVMTMPTTRTELDAILQNRADLLGELIHGRSCEDLETYGLALQQDQMLRFAEEACRAAIVVDGLMREIDR